MSKQLVFHKGRYNSVAVNLNTNIGSDVITSQIRELPEETSPLIVTWTVTVVDAAAGEITLTFNDSSGTITASKGFMDIKRLSGAGEIAMFDEPLGVEFRGAVTT